MGIGTISQEREVESGMLADGGRTAAPAAGPAASPFAAMRGVDMGPLHARRMALDNLKPVAEAWRRSQHAVEGNEMYAKGMLDLDEVSNGMPDGDHKGMWKGADGIWRQALNTPGMDPATREKLTAECLAEVERRQAERLKGWTPDMITTVKTRMTPAIEEWKARQMEQNMTLMLRDGMDKAVGSNVTIAAGMSSDVIEEYKNVDRCGKNLSTVYDLRAVEVNATKIRDEEIARTYVRKVIEAKGMAMRDIMLAGGGLVNESEAQRQADMIYGSSAVDLVRRLAEGGEYGRAMSLVEKGESLGFSKNDVEKGRTLVEKIRNDAERRAYENERRAQKAVVDEYNAAEIDFAQDNDPASWPIKLEQWSKDPRLLKFDPERAKRYAKWADDLRNCRYGKGVKYKPDGKQLTEDLYRSIQRLEALQSCDPYDVGMDQSTKNAEALKVQQAIAQKMRIGFESNVFSYDQYEGLKSRFKRTLNDQQRAAMRKFYAAFGVNAASLALGKKGELTSQDLSSVSEIDAYAPVIVDDRDGSGMMTAKQFVSLTDRFVSALDAQGEGVNRAAVVDEVIRRLKTEWVKCEDYDKRLKLMTDTLMNASREQLAR